MHSWVPVLVWRPVLFVAALAVLASACGLERVHAAPDRGDLWEALASPTTEDLHAVAFLDLDRGFAVGANGTLLATSDGGNSWKKIAITTREHLRSIAFSPGRSYRMGYIVGDAGTVLHSYDGDGQRWSHRPLQSSAALLDVSETGLAGIDYGDQAGSIYDILAGDTIDSGARSVTFHAVFSDRLAAGTTAGDGGKDRGVIYAIGAVQSWKPLWRHRHDGYYFREIAGHGESSIVACGYPSPRFPGELLATSSDGGQSWRVREGEINDAPLHDCAYTESGGGVFAVGERGSIVRSTDGGESWRSSRDPEPAAPGLLGVATAGDRVWAVGRGGVILRLEQ